MLYLLPKQQNSQTWLIYKYKVPLLYLLPKQQNSKQDGGGRDDGVGYTYFLNNKTLKQKICLFVYYECYTYFLNNKTLKQHRCSV